MPIHPRVGGRIPNTAVGVRMKLDAPPSDPFGESLFSESRQTRVRTSCDIDGCVCPRVQVLGEIMLGNSVERSVICGAEISAINLHSLFKPTRGIRGAVCNSSVRTHDCTAESVVPHAYQRDALGWRVSAITVQKACGVTFHLRRRTEIRGIRAGRGPIGRHGPRRRWSLHSTPAVPLDRGVGHDEVHASVCAAPTSGLWRCGDARRGASPSTRNIRSGRRTRGRRPARRPRGATSGDKPIRRSRQHRRMSVSRSGRRAAYGAPRAKC